MIKTRTKAITKELEYKENQTVIIPLPQDNALRRVNLHCAIEVETASGSTAGTRIKNDALLNTIHRIQLRLNGNDNLFDVDLRTYF